MASASDDLSGTLRDGFYRILLEANCSMEVPQRYQQLTLIGTGAFGIVCSAIDKQNNDTKVAIKKVSGIFKSDVHAKRIFREIYILKNMLHDNVLRLLDLFIPNKNPSEFSDVYLVTDFMEADLNRILKTQRLSDDHIQFFVYQILRGLKYVHSAHLVHRDLKPSNLAVNSDCLVKILDFGLSREVDSLMTGYVATRWWRAPEIIYNWTHYNEKVDIWSVGCIMAEMITGRILFEGKNQIDQLRKILEFTGTPTPNLMAKFSEDARNFIRNLGQLQKKDFRKVFSGANPLALDLLERMLDLDPDTRISTEEALQHEYLKAYYDPSDEPVTQQSDHSFEKEEHNLETWREKIFDEVANFVPPESTMEVSDS